MDKYINRFPDMDRYYNLLNIDLNILIFILCMFMAILGRFETADW